MAPASSTILQSKKYDVFISFRGADIRDGFLSHLHHSLLQNQVNAFVDDNLPRGKEITSSLLQIIAQSYVSIVIFSENYADSSWCLDELVKILECLQNKQQLVLPVFYHVDPSHVQELTGSYGDAIDKHNKEFSHCLDKVRYWSSALMQISSLPGPDSRIIKPESKLITEIVSYVLEKLDDATPSDFCNDGLVGIDSRIKEVRSLLCLESKDIRAIGIWGMGGIGKSTLVEKLFNQICNQFPRRCFVANVRERLENATKDSVQSEILSALLGKKNLNTGMPIMLNSYVRRRLSQGKVLIVLDDVSDLDQIERLVGSNVVFGSGSRIIITSRDKQLLKNVGAIIYQVKKLNYYEALRLFSLHAFKENSVKKEYMELSRMAIIYAQGIPLALKVLGSNLFGKSIQIWEDELEKLKSCSNKKVQKILRISYDGLDKKEKDIFLDIACFFKGYDKDSVTNILNGCGFFAKSGISLLNDRSLVTISRDNKLEMHDLLQQMGKDIVSEEKELGRRTRLWNPKDVYKVLARDMGTTRVEGILLNMSQIRFLDLSSTAFAKLCSLRILKFYEKKENGTNKILLPGGLECFPDDLRFLQWDHYPLKCFPLQFCFDHLIELCMPKSRIKQLWTEDQTLPNLKVIDLRDCVDLVHIPDLSTVPNLEVLYLHHCTSLVEIPISIQNLSKLTRLILSKCKSLYSLPSCLPSSIKGLQLYGTPIKQLPSSIGSLSHLIHLESLPSRQLESIPSSVGQLTCLRRFTLVGCSKLANLPDTICNLKSLTKLSLLNCAILNELPENLGNLESLEELSTTDSGIKRLPSSINQLRQLKYLNCSGCKGLVLPPLTNLRCLTYVSLSCCGFLEFPNSLCSLKSLEKLVLDGNDFEIIPASITQLCNLSEFSVANSRRLKQILDLPSSLDNLYARNCVSLVSASTSFLLKAMAERHWLGVLDFGNCIELTEASSGKIMDDVLTTHQDNYGVFALYIAGSDLLRRMRHQNDSGPNLSFNLGRPELIGLSFYVVVASKVYPHHGLFDIGCTANFTDNFGHSFDETFFLYGDEGREMDFQSDSVFIWRNPVFDFHSRHHFSNASLQFFLKYSNNDAVISKCGVHPIFNQGKRKKDEDEDTEDEDDEMDMEEEPHSKRYKEIEEMNEVIVTLSHCLLNNENEEEEPPVREWKETRVSKCHDVNAFLAVLLMVNTCLATSTGAKPRRTDIIFTLMMITVCLKLLSFACSLSLHGFALSLTRR
ncbi:disease resistance protein RPV1-like [Mercurialis annua]|uniref:disease resistance protein RPV1-like n=1 Tax=Mercurialis annua TaxID=3986 RepID=UPI0024AE55DE|nr:disease resistance protein RPV1-like [Mercurialis annua]